MDEYNDYNKNIGEINSDSKTARQNSDDTAQSAGVESTSGWNTAPPVEYSQNSRQAGQYGGYTPPRPAGQPIYNGYSNGNMPPLTPQAPPTNYHWNFDEYKNSGQNGMGGGKPPKKKRAKTVFVMIFMGIFAAFTVGFAAFGVYQAFSDNTVNSSSPNSSSSTGSSQSSEDNNVIVPNDDNIQHSLPIEDKPIDDTPEGSMTPQEVSSLVKPSVVSVVVYSGDNNISPASQGSGIIMSEDGYIVTNAHVVDVENPFINIILDNEEEYEARIVGSDTRTDLAVIKIDAENLTFATFGNSDQLEVGEYVLAIGNPGGVQFSGSVTLGIVSALDRTILVESSYSIKVIQTDAAINPGNSGGALVNLHGQIIGINSAKIALTDYEGIGFAIPSNNAKPIIDNLIENGYVKDRVKLGVTLQEITNQVAEAYDIPQGLRIMSIEQTSNLIAKGIKEYDIITSFDGERITTMDQLLAILGSHTPGDNVSITFYRADASGSGGDTFDINLILQEDPGT